LLDCCCLEPMVHGRGGIAGPAMVTVQHFGLQIATGAITRDAYQLASPFSSSKKPTSPPSKALHSPGPRNATLSSTAAITPRASVAMDGSARTCGRKEKTYGRAPSPTVDHYGELAAMLTDKALGDREAHPAPSFLPREQWTGRPAGLQHRGFEPLESGLVGPGR